MKLKDRLIWAYISKDDILTEKKECIEEGKDISALSDEFKKYSSEDTVQEILEDFLEKTYKLPTSANEPSDFEEIMALCKGQEDYRTAPSDLEDRIAGAWLGRIAGCQLGKPFEGAYKTNIENYLKETDCYPLKYYAKYSRESAEKYKTHTDPLLYSENINKANSDDDLNYPVLNLKIYKDCKSNPEPHDFAIAWLSNLPFNYVCTAERVAYRNFIKCIDPPLSASFRNPYREWIGAQIRADFWGWINPISPKKAVSLAYKDACISHTKNGIYGELFVASMLANAFHQKDIKSVVEKGLCFVPQTSRLYRGVNTILNLFKDGKTYEESIDYIHSVWDEKLSHDWCHTVSNAEIVVSALLWGKDFTDTITKAVMAGFDTDCNGATAGSIIGLFLGKNSIPAKWYELFNDTLETEIIGYNTVRISDLINQTILSAKENI